MNLLIPLFAYRGCGELVLVQNSVVSSGSEILFSFVRPRSIMSLA